MATYKKKPKKESKEQRMERKSSTARFFGKLDYFATAFEDWIARNRKPILTVIGVIIVGVLGYLVYNNFVLKPRQEEAVAAMSQPMNYFDRALQLDPGVNQDTLFIKSLHGAGSYGLLDIIEKYDGTPAANIAQYSAGMALLKLGKYQEAVSHLEKFSSEDAFLPALAKGAIGDAFVENGQPDVALDYYKQAATIRTNNFTTPKFLLKAAITAINLGKKEEAENFLNRIKKEYPKSPEAVKVPGYLGMAQNSTSTKAATAATK